MPPKKNAKAPPPVADLAFEAAIQELEGLTTQIESGTLPLEETVAAYRRGVELNRHCRSILDRVEGEVMALEKDGGVVPFEASPSDA